MKILLTIILSLLISVGSYFARFLTFSGAIATMFLAIVIYGLGGWVWTVPILVFFVSSSFLSRIRAERKKEFAAIFEKSSRRDAGQVLANGGLAGILVVVWSFLHHETIYIAYLGTVSAVTADTWSTELGVLSRSEPRSITSLTSVPSGTSGAVSVLGLIAGLLGSMLIFAVGTPCLRVAGVGKVSTFLLFTVVVVSGICGNLLDSLLGATVQSQYRCRGCGKMTERKVHCAETKTELVRGKTWVTNDVINFVCAVSGAGIAFAAFNL